ncbi:MAG: hypothetical protein K0R03_2116 [Moraxellaceae bacterium]|nr:hypothetical protein [Moraxellaceae bacterium]
MHLINQHARFEYLPQISQRNYQNNKYEPKLYINCSN